MKKLLFIIKKKYKNTALDFEKKYILYFSSFSLFYELMKFMKCYRLHALDKKCNESD